MAAAIADGLLSKLPISAARSMDITGNSEDDWSESDVETKVIFI